MNRVYHVNPTRQKLQKEILARIGALRQSINPDVLARARVAILGHGEGGIEALSVPEEVLLPDGRIAIDQKKNLHTVMQVLSLNPNNKGIHKEIQSWLAEQG